MPPRENSCQTYLHGLEILFSICCLGNIFFIFKLLCGDFSLSFWSRSTYFHPNTSPGLHRQKEDLVVFLLLFLHSSVSSGLANPLMIQTTGCLVPRLLAVHQHPLVQGNVILFLIQKSVSVRRHSPCPRSPSCTSRRSSSPSLSSSS